jgi:hypothetical protein
MDKYEIKSTIEKNNAEIVSLCNPNNFVFIPRVNQLLRENAVIRSNCEHSFKDGVCEYCQKEE